MSSTEAAQEQREKFASFVASCTFFDASGVLDLEKFCMHLYLALFSDAAPAPQPIALYELMLKVIGKQKPRLVKNRIYKIKVENWDESLRNYYPDQERTCLHYALVSAVYPTWIQQVGTELLHHKNPHDLKGRFWIQPEWPITSQYINRFEAELLRVVGLAGILRGDGSGQQLS
ncbi:MAG: hypothetical protein VR73_00705 [Gammaproteobacteria bacterium BRH_c0]|nr:MAG: hypothetical protein VR73_00705 [Gammaproteobacteria bacterium BRH_c0]